MTSILLAMVLGVLAPAPCELRCRCIDPSSRGQTHAEATAQRMARSERVVLGTVLRIDTLPRTEWGVSGHEVVLQPVVARIRVTRVWRGPATDTMTVMLTTTVRVSSCDLMFQPGSSWLIFAARTGDGPLATQMCSGTVQYSLAAETIQALGPGRVIRP